MSHLDYLTCFAVGLLGAVIHALMKIKSIEDKAKLANVQFKANDYLLEDWKSHLISLCTLLICLFFIGDAIRFHADIIYYMKFAFAFIGYTGNDIASRVFGAVNKRVNTVIDKKTTEADQANNETEPTPHK